MSDDNFVNELLRQDRVLITAELQLASGSFFQPTGFPDIGACVYTDGNGERRCLVESEQSMANRLEAVCMTSPGIWREPLAGRLPIIRVESKSRSLIATNLTEPHRIASSYVLQGKINGTTLQAKLERHLGLEGKGWPLDRRERLSETVFALDPAAVLHGFQFMQWEAVGLRAARLLHSRLEAVLADEGEVHYGLVKVDNIEPESSSAKKSNKGQSIAHRARYVPKSIQASFEIDVLALRERSLVGEPSASPEAKVAMNQGAQKFLLSLALWKIHRFLTNGPAFDSRTGETMGALRLRTDCSLAVDKVSWSGSKQGAPFRTSESLDLGSLVNRPPNSEVAGLIVEPPSFERLLSSFDLALETTVVYGKK